MIVHKEVGDIIFKSFHEVHSKLGFGLLESVYEKAMGIELGLNGVAYEFLKGYRVKYKGIDVGNFYADIVVENKILIELKTVKALTDRDVAQVLHYLRISGLRVGYLVNFRNCELEWKRLIV